MPGFFMVKICLSITVLFISWLLALLFICCSSGVFNMFRIIIVAAALLFSSFSFSADYVWKEHLLNGNYVGGEDLSTPTAICIRAHISRDAFPGYTFGTIQYRDSSSFTCIENTPGGPNPYALAIRSGNSCPSGATFNPSTGQCELPINECKDKTETIRREKTGFEFSTSTAYTKPPASTCVNSCQYTLSVKTAEDFECYVYVNPDGTDQRAVKCDYNYKGSGVACSATDGVTDQAKPDAKTPAAVDKSGCDPSSTDPATGIVSQKCNGTTSFTDPGNVICPGAIVSGDGSTVPCTAGTPKPQHKKDSTATIKSETKNPDGSTTTKTTTTTTSTSCVGLGACSTTTTTNTTTGGNNSDGSQKPNESQCTGPKCQSDLKPDEEGEEEEPSASGTGCDQALQCDGDAVLCAILQSQKEEKCNAEEAGDYPAKKADIDGLFSGADFKAPEESKLDLAGIFNSGTRFFPSACPVDKPIYISSFKRSINISWAPFCKLAEIMSFMIVAVASLFFIRYVGEAL